MNFHNKSGLDAHWLEARPVYRPAPRGVTPRVSTAKRLRALAEAPFLGSAFIFPRRFDRAVGRLLKDPESVSITPDHAASYFGPLLHLEVDPGRLVDRISDYVLAPNGPKWMGTSFLDAADWGAVVAPIDQSPVHREMTELVHAGRDYRDTWAYRSLIRAIELGSPMTRNGVKITNTDEIEAYIHYCRDLIKSARKRGVVRRKASGAFHRLRVKHRDARSPALDTSERDIGVAITAGGELVRHLGGKHRTAIAQALKLPSLPVEITLIHVHWIAERMQRTGLPAHLALKHGVSELRAALQARA
ncbi:MAG: hypothetical protein ACRED5_18600 [Propylenella sp.]